MIGPRVRAREVAASAAQYALLGGFASVAAGISAQGLTGFARVNMGLRGPWPYLLFFALDGAAGVCAVLLMRRAARADSGLAPRLAVWGLVAASAAFNWTHAPRRPAAPEAFGLMPVIAAVLFEFTLRELRLRTAGRADRRLTALRWLHPAERIRVQLLLAADEQMSAEAATRRVRVDQAARRLYLLRRVLGAREQAARPGAMAARRARMAERRAHRALTRAGFADPDIAAGVLRQVQVLALTPRLARLNYDTADAARTAVASLITPGPPAAPPDVMPAAHDTPAGSTDRGTAQASRPYATGINGHAAAGEAIGAGQPGLALPAPAPGTGTAPQAAKQGNEGEAAAGEDGNRDAQLIAAAASILAEAMRHGDRLSQTALAEKLRSQGHSIANERLRWLLAEASNLAPDQHPGSEPPEPGAPPATAEPSGQLPATAAAAGSRTNGNARNQAAPPHQRQPGQHGIQLPGGP
jgi:Protein of unknown function (DUF2637)